jgi:AraC-like DNA-binding protein
MTSTLAELCSRWAPNDGANPTALPGVAVYRRDFGTGPEHGIYTRRLFIVAQGRKSAMVGDDIFVYDPENYLVISVPLPVVSEIMDASSEVPFLSVAIEFSIESVRDVLLRGAKLLQSLEPPKLQRGLAVSNVEPRMKLATLRLLSLLDAPEDIEVLAEPCIQEILYYVLKGPQGGFLRAMAMGDGHQRLIADVLMQIHDDCTQDFNVPELAAQARMSETVFYEAFRSVTASTPIQYIKRLRLLQAHRQLVMDGMNVSEAAFSVGYNSTSQFSREFKRVFGASPSHYVQQVV